MPTISRALRFRVLERDGFTCRYCGAKAPNVVLEVDHLIPVSAGGSGLSHNLVTACFDCNRGKRDRQLSAQLIAELTPPVLVRVTRIRKVRTVRVFRTRKPAPPVKRQLLIVSLERPYLGPDNPAAEWECASCGFHNVAESDVCGCERRARERENPTVERCRGCGEAVYDEYRLCEDCYYVFCTECGESERAFVDGEYDEWCEDCLALSAEKG